MKFLELINSVVRFVVVYIMMKGLDIVICLRMKEGMLVVVWVRDECFEIVIVIKKW